MCVEAHYLGQALLDQRAFAATFDTTFTQASGWEQQEAGPCAAHVFTSRENESAQAAPAACAETVPPALPGSHPQAKRMLVEALQAVAELRRLLVAPARADLAAVGLQVEALTAALEGWVGRFAGSISQASGCGASA